MFWQKLTIFFIFIDLLLEVKSSSLFFFQNSISCPMWRPSCRCHQGSCRSAALQRGADFHRSHLRLCPRVFDEHNVTGTTETGVASRGGAPTRRKWGGALRGGASAGFMAAVRAVGFYLDLVILNLCYDFWFLLSLPWEGAYGLPKRDLVPCCVNALFLFGLYI